MIGTKLSNRYEILRELGRGGMGVVYLARDPMLGRDVAAKLMTPNLMSPEATERFKREARVVAQMDHPAIVGVYDIGDHEGSLFFVMPFVAGSSLRVFLMEGSLSLGDVIDIGIQVSDALEYSHSNGIVHRDIKPENIMVRRQESGDLRVRVTDFGLAMASSEGRLTKTGALVGTLSYLSPEQVRAHDVDSRTDIYALGTLLYECLAGRPPFSGEVQSVLYRIAHEIPEGPRSLGADVQEDLEGIVMRCLEKDPASRPQRAREVVDALSRHRSKLREIDRSQKISAYHRTTIRSQQPPAHRFVGREKEFAELQRRLNAACAGECQLALVGGEVGVGKSRLLDELEKLAAARKIQVLHGRFVQLDQSFVYQGFCDAIQEYFRGRAASASPPPVDFSDLAPGLVSLFPVLSEIQEIRSSSSAERNSASAEPAKPNDRTFIYELLARSLIRISGGKPLLLLLEDLHAANVSVDALQYIVRRLGTAPVLIVATYRTEEVVKRHPVTRLLDHFQGDRRFSMIRLERMLPSEHRLLVESLVGSSDLENSFANRLYEATDGNPYFTKELIRSLIDSGKIVKTQTGSYSLSGETAISSETLPHTVQQAVERRIEQLPKQLRDILSTASVLGKVFLLQDLLTLAGKKERTESAVERLILDGFLAEERESRGERFTFCSGVVRDVLYAKITRPKRKSLHRKYAEDLEQRNPDRLERVYPQLLHHYLQAGVHEKVVEYGLKLARKSLDAFSADDAINAAKMALASLSEKQGWDRLFEGEARTMLASAHRMAGNIDLSLEESQKAIEIFGQEHQASRAVAAMLMAAETAWGGMKVEAAERWLEKGIEAARIIGENACLTRLCSLGATLASLRGDYEKAKSFVQEVEQLHPSVQAEQPEIHRGGTLTVAMPALIQANHPAESTIIEEDDVFPNVFETLLAPDRQGGLAPCLCERWDVLEEGCSMLLTLRQNVRMHDGSKLTARDVKKSFESAIRRSRKTLPEAYSAIQGVPEYLNGTVEEVLGIVVVSEYKLQIQLLDAIPIYPVLLADYRAAIVKEIGKGDAEPRLVGTGPFQVESFAPQRVLLRRNPDYWKGGTTNLDAVEFRCGLSSAEIAAGFRSGEFDLVRDLLPEELEDILRDRRLRATIAETPKKNTYFALFNRSSSIAGIPVVRMALCGVVRTHDLVRKTLGRYAQPAEGLLPPGILGHDAGRRRQPMQFERAADLLKSSGLQLPLRLKASVHPIFQDRYATLMHELFKEWSGIGVEVSIETPTMASHLQSLKNNEGIDVLIGRWNPDYEDPDNFTYALFHSEAGQWKDYYSSKEMDQLTEEARGERSLGLREKLYRKIENLLAETGVLLPLFHDVDYRVASSRIRDLALRATPPNVNYAELSKAEWAPATVFRKGAGSVIHVPIIGEIRNLDPSLAFAVVQEEVMPTIFENLTRDTKEARIIPWLASELHQEDQGRRYRFHLREDVRFHDGRRVTARDVRFSFERLLQNRGESRWLLSPIRGARALLEGHESELEGFQILSASEFVIHLEQPVSFFTALLAHFPSAIVPEGTVEFAQGWREGCVGTGPFRVARFDPGRSLELEASPHYWRKGYPKCDGLVFLFGLSPQETLEGFRAGRFSLAWNLSPPDADALRHQTGVAFQYSETPQLQTYSIAFNIHRQPFANDKIRRRFVRAIDVGKIVRRNIGRMGIPASGLIPPGLLGYERTSSAYSSFQQKEERAEEIEITGQLSPRVEKSYSSLVEELLVSLRQNGFRIRLLEPGYLADAPASVDFVVSGWAADYPDADTFAHGFLHSEHGRVGRLCGTSEIDRLIEKGRIEMKPEIRHDIYREIEEILADRALLLPLFHEQAYRFARPEVEDLEFASLFSGVAYEKLWVRR